MQHLYVQLLSYDINKWSFSQKHICMKRFFPFYESSEAPYSFYVFHKGLRRMKTRTQKTARREKSCECTNKSRWQPVYCFVAHYSQSVRGISFGPPLTSHQMYSNQCKFIYKLYGRLPQTCPFWSHEEKVSRNKLRCYILTPFHSSQCVSFNWLRLHSQQGRGVPLPSGNIRVASILDGWTAHTRTI